MKSETRAEVSENPEKSKIKLEKSRKLSKFFKFFKVFKFRKIKHKFLENSERFWEVRHENPE